MAGPWTALVPIKPPGMRKTRLAARLNTAERNLLSEALFQHVVSVLQTVALISKIVILSAHDIPGWDALHMLDEGRGLNEEIAAVQAHHGARCLLVIHADLPFVSAEDINLLLSSCKTGGVAVAPDRHGSGTNAIALSGVQRFSFAFGEASFERHLTLASIPIQLVQSPGLALDIDTPADLDLAIRLGLNCLLENQISSS